MRIVRLQLAMSVVRRRLVVCTPKTYCALRWCFRLGLGLQQGPVLEGRRLVYLAWNHLAYLLVGISHHSVSCVGGGG